MSTSCASAPKPVVIHNGNSFLPCPHCGHRVYVSAQEERQGSMPCSHCRGELVVYGPFSPRGSVPPKPAEPDQDSPDTGWVCEQMADVLDGEVRAGSVRDAHPFGSTVAVEESVEVDPAVAQVRIPVETEMLPVECYPRVWVEVGYADRQVELECRLQRIDEGDAVYSVDVADVI